MVWKKAFPAQSPITHKWNAIYAQFQRPSSEDPKMTSRFAIPTFGPTSQHGASLLLAISRCSHRNSKKQVIVHCGTHDGLQFSAWKLVLRLLFFFCSSTVSYLSVILSLETLKKVFISCNNELLHLDSSLFGDLSAVLEQTEYSTFWPKIWNFLFKFTFLQLLSPVLR